MLNYFKIVFELFVEVLNHFILFFAEIVLAFFVFFLGLASIGFRNIFDFIILKSILILVLLGVLSAFLHGITCSKSANSFNNIHLFLSVYGTLFQSIFISKATAFFSKLGLLSQTNS